MNQSLVFGAAILVVVVALGGLNYYTYSTLSTQLSDQKAEESIQVSSLQNQVNSLQTKASSLQNGLSQLQQSQAATASQVSSIQGSLQSIQTQLSSVQGELQSQINLNYQTLGQQIQNISVKLQTLSTKLSALFPQVPQTTLVVTSSSYNSSTATYTFGIHNTQNFVVYAQLGASFYGNPCSFYAGEGSSLSQVYAFGPNTTLSIVLNFKDQTFYSSSFCGKEPIAYFSASLVASTTVLSPTYTFYVNPPYQF